MRARKRARKWIALSLACVGIFSAAAHSQVITDGSLGTATSVTGPSFFIGSGLGQQRGANLFHSFSTFNVGAGQHAIFDTATGTVNVIARVTGNGASTINGAVSANANLFLMNPQGIVFGPSAVLNVNGSFHATTADYLRLNDGARFYASLGQSSVLSVAAPAAFGFLDSVNAPIVLQNSFLAVPDSQMLSLVGGHITLINSQLGVSNGRLNIIAAGSAGEAIFGGFATTVTGMSAFSDIQFNQSRVNSGIEEAANIYIRGGRFVMENQSGIVGVTSTPGAQRTIDIDVDVMQLRNSLISTAATLNGPGSATNIRAREFDVADGSGVLITAGGANPGGDISIRADTFRLSGGLSLVGTAAAQGTGRAGNVSIQANTISVADGAISAISGTSGAAGSIDLVADAISLSRGGGVTSGTSSSGTGGRIGIRARDLTIDGTQGTLATGVSAVTTSTIPNAGNAGAVSIDVDSLTLRRGFISSSTGGPGRGGDIAINARAISLERSSSLTTETGVPAGQGAQTFGSGGAIVLTAQTAQIASGSRVSASTFGNGTGGSVAINSNRLTIDRAGDTSFTGIAANTGAPTNVTATGAGGSVTLRVADLQLINRGEVAANTYGSGLAGRIDIVGTNLVLANAGSISASSFGQMPNAGRANDILITADSLQVADASQIANFTLGSGAAGRLLITATDLDVLSGGTLQASSLSSGANPGATGDIFINGMRINVDGGSVNARSLGAAAPGGIVISAASVRLDNGAVLSATGIGAGNAGNIVVNAGQFIELDHGSRIVTEALNGSGGNVRLFANERITFRNSLVSTSVLGPASNGGNIAIDPIFVIIQDSQIIARAVGGSGGNINIATQYLFQSANSIVDASSQVGISGRVQVVGADVDLNADIATLPMDFLNAQQWLSTACAARQGGDVSQFTVNGRDGVYRSPFDLISSPLSLDIPFERSAKRKATDLFAIPMLSFAPECLRGPG